MPLARTLSSFLLCVSSLSSLSLSLVRMRILFFFVIIFVVVENFVDNKRSSYLEF